METDSSANRWRGAGAKSTQRKIYWAGATVGFGATIYRNMDVIRPVAAGIAGGVAGFAAGGPAGAAQGAMMASAAAI